MSKSLTITRFMHLNIFNLKKVCSVYQKLYKQQNNSKVVFFYNQKHVAEEVRIEEILMGGKQVMYCFHLWHTGLITS